MATLLNPLDAFQSYSIHHILIACRTTEEAKAFTNESENTATLAAISDVAQLGDPINYGQSSNTAFLVLDTRRFSQFSVDKMSYEVLINGVEQGSSPGNLATNVNMTILDSVGISFINFLQWLMDSQMQTNFDGIIFMHRTLFIGHTADGMTETVQSVTIPMNLFKLELNLDYSKGAYTAEFMPNMNFDVVKHDRWMNIAASTRYFTGKSDNTLGGIVNNFEAQLNDAASKYYNDAQEAFKSAGRTGKFGRLVRYMITIPKEWQQYEFTGAATANATETVFKKIQTSNSTASSKKDAAAAGTPKDTHLAVEPGMKITEVLDIMFGQVKDIADLGAGRKTTNSVIFYKYFVGVTSDDETVVLHVDVVPFEVPNVVPGQSGVDQGVDQYYNVMDDGSRVPKNFAEFDFIYTGKNKDIINFDMKMQDLSFLLASNLSLLGPGAVQLDDTSENVSEKAAPSQLAAARPYDALLPPRNSADELKNFSKYAPLIKKSEEAVKTAQDYTRNLSLFYTRSPITAIMNIRGNPLIMAKFNQNQFLEHKFATTQGANGNSSTNTQVKADYRAAFEKNILSNNTHVDANGNTVQEITNQNGTFTVANTLGNGNYATSPVFVKVNIKGPKVDFRTGAQKMEEDFAEELIQDNYFVVFKVTNNIEGHNFTQELELYSHSIFGLSKTSTKAKTI